MLCNSGKVLGRNLLSYRFLHFLPLISRYKSTMEKNEAQQYYEKRLAFLAEQKEAGINPYPHEFPGRISILEFSKIYDKVLKCEDRQEIKVSLARRIMNKRSSSSKLYFYDLQDDGGKTQIMTDVRSSELEETEFIKLHESVKRGDIVGITGFPGKNKRGQLCIFPNRFVVLSHCLHILPLEKANVKKMESWVPGLPRHPDQYILNDQEIRYGKRFLDMIVNADVRKVLKIRARVISFIRRFLDKEGFLEVETPVMNTTHSIGAARPFVVSNDELKMTLFMRIAPELHLKQLLVGGYERVFEIGKQFRCENIDMTHHPEFTTCEFYMAYADYNNLIIMTEKMLSEMVMELTGSLVIKCHDKDKKPREIDFTPPFRRIDMIEELEKVADLSIPKDLLSEEANKYLIEACERHGIKCEPPRRTARLLDKLADHFLGENCVNPTFIMNHPVIMSYMAKHHRSKEGLTERFELFVNKRELINAYTELNDPIIQREQFTNQDQEGKEATTVDETFLRALEYGLPPSAGWGLGVDRLVMLLTGSENIKEVILFPLSNKKRKRGDEIAD